MDVLFFGLVADHFHVAYMRFDVVESAQHVSTFGHH